MNAKHLFATNRTCCQCNSASALDIQQVNERVCALKWEIITLGNVSQKMNYTALGRWQ